MLTRLYPMIMMSDSKGAGLPIPNQESQRSQCQAIHLLVQTCQRRCRSQSQTSTQSSWFPQKCSSQNRRLHVKEVIHTHMYSTSWQRGIVYADILIIEWRFNFSETFQSQGGLCQTQIHYLPRHVTAWCLICTTNHWHPVTNQAMIESSESWHDWYNMCSPKNSC